MGIIMKNDVPYPGAGEPNRELKDNGTSLTDRNTINFTDFDMSDNSTDEETDVKPHRLTNAELDEIVLPVAHEYEGEVIDLRGNEIKVGTVIASDGTKKTLWQKTVSLDAGAQTTGAWKFSYIDISDWVDNTDYVEIANASMITTSSTGVQINSPFYYQNGSSIAAFRAVIQKITGLKRVAMNYYLDGNCNVEFRVTVRYTKAS